MDKIINIKVEKINLKNGKKLEDNKKDENEISNKEQKTIGEKINTPNKKEKGSKILAGNNEHESSAKRQRQIRITDAISTKSKNISEKDKIYEAIQLKLNNKELLSKEEEIYLSIYNDCKKELNVNEFSLIHYKKNHTSFENGKIKNIFHKALRNLTKEKRKIFFDFYEFLPCMAKCYDLIYGKK